MSLCCCAMYVNVYIHYSLLILCAVVKYKMYGPPSLLQFGIHSYSTVGVQEFESLGKVFIIRHFKSQGGLHSNGRKKKQGARESSFCIHCILPSKDYAIVAVICSKGNSLFCSYHRRFSKDKSQFGSQTGNNCFRLEG